MPSSIDRQILVLVAIYVICGFLGFGFEYHLSGGTKDLCGDSLQKNILRWCLPFLHVYALGGLIITGLYVWLKRAVTRNSLDGFLPRVHARLSSANAILPFIVFSVIAGLLLGAFECLGGVANETLITNGVQEWDYTGYHPYSLCGGYTALDIMVMWAIFAGLFYLALQVTGIETIFV